MTVWLQLALVLLQIANKIFSSVQEQKLIDSGYDKAMAEEAAKILRKSKYAKSVMENINKLNDNDVDKLLRSLEPTNDK